MMDYDLRKYLKVYDNIFTPDFCAATVSQLEKAPWIRHAYNDPVADQNASYEDDLYVTGYEIPNKQKIDNEIWNVINTYLRTDMGFVNSWYSSWQGYTLSRFNRYSPGERMRVHCDHIHSIFDGSRKGIPVLTVLGGLNNDYEGGDLVLWEKEKIELKAGSVMVFPSNFLYPHRVDPTTTGVRYSFVSWVW